MQKYIQTKEYLNYQPQLKKLNLLSLIFYSISLLLMVLLIFLPIYNATYTKKITIEDFDGNIQEYMEFASTLEGEELEAFLNGEYEVTESFSIFSEFEKVLNFISTEELDFDKNYIDVDGKKVDALSSVMPLMCTGMIILMSLLFVCTMNIKPLIEEIGYFTNREKYSSLKYTFLKKSTETDTLVKSQRNPLAACIGIMVMSILFMLFDKIMPVLEGEVITVWGYFSGVNASIIIVAVLFVGAIVVNKFINNTKNDLIVDISNN